MSEVETVRCPKSRAEHQVTVSLRSLSWDKLHNVSTQHFVLCRQNIQDTPLPFPSIVSCNTIQESKASSLKISFEIPLLASRLLLCVMVEKLIQ